jgi:transposase
MNVRYRVELSQAERGELTALLSGGKHAARKLKRAQILLAADAGAGDEDIAISVGVGGSTVYRTKRRFLVGNLEEALSEEPRPGASRKLSGKEEALLIATACSNPPEGRARWTLELLADELVRLTEHDSISRETVRRRLTENDLKPWRKDRWCIPHIDGEYVARMEDVLDLYAQAPDPKRPVVCFDESPTQLIGEVRQPIQAVPGQRERYDCEYRRNGTVNMFIFLDAHRPWRKVKVTDRRTAEDLPFACANSAMCTFPRQIEFVCAENFAADLTAFHEISHARRERFPDAMLATATHDHKRGEDVRMHLAVLSEIAGEWAAKLAAARRSCIRVQSAPRDRRPFPGYMPLPRELRLKMLRHLPHRQPPYH